MSRWLPVVGFLLLPASGLHADVWDAGATSDNDAGTRNELAHGSSQDHDLGVLPGPVPDEDWYRVHQAALSSYEIVVDSTSADIGSGQGPSLERIASDQTTVVQGSVSAGAGASRSLRWENPAAVAVEGQYVRVRSAGCTLTCDPQDVYRIRAYDTTYSMARLNNSATQVTVLIVANPTADSIAGNVHYWSSAGSLITSQAFTAGPRSVVVLNTLGSAPGQSGSVTASHDGCYGCLAGKAVAVEPATGFTFDTPLVPRLAPGRGPAPTGDTVPPPAPTGLTTNPVSPANNNSPAVLGNAEPGSTVNLYTTPTCTGTVAATGSAAAFAFPGLTVGVSDDSTTTFFAAAIDAALNTSPCSTGVTYVEDSTAPNAPGAFSAAPLRRNAVRLSWTAPSDGGVTPVASCTARKSRFPIDPGNWGGATTVASVPGAPPGTPQTTDVSPIDLGGWYFGLRCYDAAGNESPLSAAGPTTVVFTQGPAIAPASVVGYNGDDAYLGYAITSADLNADGFSDLVVGAPNAEKLPAEGLGEGLVYVYMGGATGIGSTPSFVIRGNDVGGDGWFGASLAVLDWNADGTEDVAIGSPFGAGYQGEVRVFFGSTVTWNPGGSTILLDDTDADVLVYAPPSPSGPEPNTWFYFGALGWRLDSLDFDGDGRDDLLIGVPGAGTFKGGAVVLFGGSAASTILLPDGLPAAGTTAYRFTFTSGTAPTPQYGSRLASLGALGNGPGPDTRDDIVVGPDADGASGPNPIASEERVFVFYGRPQPASGMATLGNDAAEEQIVAEPEADDNTHFGEGLGSIADQDADGRREIVVTSWAWGINQGRAYLVPGGTNTAGGPQIVKDLAVPGTALMTITEAATQFAFGVAAANTARSDSGDIDGGGEDDLVLTNRLDSTGAPALYAWHSGSGLSGAGTPAGAAGATSGPPAFVWSTTVTWCGDLNGDGLADLVWADAMFANSTIVDQTGTFQALY